MSKAKPGVIFDASNSWNGFNHQGKLAILIAIKQILEIYDNSVSKEDNQKKLSDYFIEIEYLEDFSLGKIVNNNVEYYSVHQVKNHATEIAANYNSALLGLAYHVQTMPSIKNAYLHATTEIKFKGDSVTEYVKKLISQPSDLSNLLSRIDEVRGDESKKKALCAKKKGRPEDFIASLKQALFEVDNSQKSLDASNIDKALDALEKKTNNQIRDIGTLSDEQISKIDLYAYEINGIKQRFCEVDKIQELIKNEIENSIKKLGLSSQWLSTQYLNNRYLYLLGKLDEHIIDRNLNYPLYRDDSLDRKIRLSQVYEWLTDDQFDVVDEEYYHFKLKENFSKYSDKFCKKCNSRKCNSCLLVPAIDKIGRFSKDEMKSFLTLTCPSNTEGLSFSTAPSYLSESQIRDPFFFVFRDISIAFEEDKQAITYIGKETLQYILTTLVIDEDYQDNEEICTDIIKNKELYDLMMDYDSFISKNLSCKSIQDEARKLGKSPVDNPELEEKRKEHIAHLKDVSIITLTEFESII